MTLNNPIIVFHKQNDFMRKLKHCIPDITIVEKNKMTLLIREARMRPISCVVLHVEHDIPEKPVFERFKNRFPGIPCVAVVGSPNMELARYCGSVGIESVLHDKDFESIEKEIVRVCAEKNNRISLLEIGIDKTNHNYSTTVKEALALMEQNYQKILNTNEIADWMEVAECTLSREFAKLNLSGPKKILSLLKVQHAIKLMKNKGLNIREISSLSGFTDEKRMAECFHRMFDLPPGEYRQRNVNKPDYIQKVV